MQTLKLIAALLHYPQAELQAAAPWLTERVADSTELEPDQRAQLSDFLHHLASRDLLELQETYVETFDRGRACALHLFEHVHGESRDRGQAMVDLAQVYRRAGFEIAVAELPDYLPLFLEFLSTRPAAEARDWLTEVGHILGQLYARLAARDSPYAVLLAPLLSLAGLELAPEVLAEAAGARDDTPEALDQAWAEEPVSFGFGASPCPSLQPRRSPFPVKRATPANA